MTKGVPPRPLRDRFEEKFEPEPNTGCWLWTAGYNKMGYGRVAYGGKNGGAKLAHRVSWEIYRGPIPGGLCVCHKCDNPPCVNPDHMFLGTRGDNLQDAKRKGRLVGVHVGLKGESSPNAKLRASDVVKIRASTQPQRKLAQEYGVSQGTINHIKLGTVWRSVVESHG